MIKVFVKNANGKIELSEDELKNLLDEAYWDGFKANHDSWVYATPTWKPYVWNLTTSTNTAISKEYLEVTNNLEAGE